MARVISISAYSAILGCFLLYIVFPSLLLYLRGGHLYWAAAFDAPGLVSRSLCLCLVALLAFYYGVFIARRRRKRRLPPRTSNAHRLDWEQNGLEEHEPRLP